MRQLFYLYFSPAFEDLEKAQTCLTELEMLNPSAHNGMESALFWMNCKNDPVNAKKWFGITAVRAESENSIPTLYTATAFEGVLAAREANLSEVREVLGKLSSIVEIGQELPWGRLPVARGYAPTVAPCLYHHQTSNIQHGPGT